MKAVERWWQRAIFYELYVDKFAGDLRALAEHTPYFKELGIDCVHILPHYPSPMIDCGYDVSDYLGVRGELGTIKDFEFFAARASEAGIKIMVDLVLNHTSTSHPWFREALDNPKSPKRKYYLWSETGSEYPEAVNAFKDAKPQNWILNKKTGDYYFSTFYQEQADLNWQNPRVLGEITSIMDFWVARGVSAFRLDAVSHLVKREGTQCKNLPETHAVIKKIRAHVNRSYPHVVLNGEVHDELDSMREYFGNGDECHLLYHFPLAEALIFEAVVGEKNFSAEYLQRLNDVPEGSSWLAFLRNHDDISLETLSKAARQKLMRRLDLKNQLQFGSGVALRLRNACAKSAAGTDRCARGIIKKLFSIPAPIVIYYGDEIGMENSPFSKSARDVRKFVRGPFDWARVEKQRGDPVSIFSFVKTLVAARKNLLEPRAILR